jgi:hypothetical protein
MWRCDPFHMAPEIRDPRRAARLRDAARARMRRVTQVTVAAAVALGAAFAGLAAASTHTKKQTVRPASRASTPARPLTVAPAPPLVSAQAQTPSSSSSSSSQSQSSTPAVAPAPSSAPPVVSSGGS